jgi:Glycosyl transferase family 2
MTKSISFTAIIPLYNKASFILSCLDSAAAQSQPPEEIIVIDDGSTDEGALLVEGWHKLPLRLIRQKNMGPGAARNLGLEEAVTSHVAFLDADDIWLPHHLEVLGELVRAFPQSKLFGAAMVDVEGDAPIPQSSFDGRRWLEEDLPLLWAVSGPPFGTTTVAVNRSQALAVGGFDETERRGEDMVLWMKLTAEASAALSSRVGGVYRHNVTGLTNQPPLEQDALTRHLRKMIAGEIQSGRHSKESLDALRRKIALVHAAGWIKAGNRRLASYFLHAAGKGGFAVHIERKLMLLIGPLWPIRRVTLWLAKKLGTRL